LVTIYMGYLFGSFSSPTVASFPRLVLLGGFFVSLSVQYDRSARALVLDFRHRHVLDTLIACVMIMTIAAALSAGCKDVVRLVEAPEVSVSVPRSALCDETDRCERVTRGWWSQLRHVLQGAFQLNDECLGLWHPDGFDKLALVVIEDIDPVSGASILSHDGCGYGRSKESELHVTGQDITKKNDRRVGLAACCSLDGDPTVA
jgi:hypothetical protein